MSEIKVIKLKTLTYMLPNGHKCGGFVMKRFASESELKDFVEGQAKLLKMTGSTDIKAIYTKVIEKTILL